MNWSFLLFFILIPAFSGFPQSVASVGSEGSTVTPSDWVEFTFGWEFTFTNEEIRSARREAIALEASYSAIDSYQLYLEVWHNSFVQMTENLKLNFSRIFPSAPSQKIAEDRGFNGWNRAIQLDTTRMLPHEINGYKVGFSFGYDDGVIEVKSWAGGHKLRNLHKVADALQILIFNSAEASGIRPYSELGVGGGHINIGIEPFRNHPQGGLWLANVLISLINEYELYQGLLTPPDWRNAKPYQVDDEVLAHPIPLNDERPRTESHWNQVLSFVEGVRSLGPNPSFQEVWDLASHPGHFGRPHYGFVGSNWADNRPVVVRGVGEQERIELRGVAPQPDFATFLAQGAFLENVFNQLRTLDELIEPRPAEAVLQPNTPLPDETLLQALHRLTRGLSPSIALQILPRHLRVETSQTPEISKASSNHPSSIFCRSLIQRLFSR